MDREASHAAAHGVTKGQTQLSDWTEAFILLGFPGGSDGKESAYNEEDLGWIPGLETSPGKGNGYPLQYSYLKNPHGQGVLVGYSPWGHRVRHDWATKHTHKLLFVSLHIY